MNVNRADSTTIDWDAIHAALLDEAAEEDVQELIEDASELSEVLDRYGILAYFLAPVGSD